MKKVGIIVGHTNEKGGAINYLGEHEYAFNCRIADAVALKINEKYKSLLEVKVFRRHVGPYSSLVPDVRLYGPNMTLELHFNAAASKAYGVEMLVYQDGPRAHDNARLADMITDMFADEYGVRERHTHRLDDDSISDGVKFFSEGRGIHNLKTIHSCGVPFVMLFEPVFGNFETKESKAIFEDEDRYIDFLVKALGEAKESI